MGPSSHHSNAYSPSYEECRRKRLEENRKRMEALNLPQLTQSHRKSVAPMKNVQNRRSMKRLEKAVKVVVRRSSRVANMPAATSYQGEVVVDRVVDTEEGMSHLVCVSEEAREYALEKAAELRSTLEPQCPTLVRSMLPSHVSSCFWMGLPVKFCQMMHPPKADTVINLIDEEGEGSPVIYLARKTGITGGWRGFSISHDLADGDAVIFQLIQPTSMKVYIIRMSSINKNATVSFPQALKSDH